MSDPDYHPSPIPSRHYEPSNAETTPSQRIVSGKSSMPPGAKRRVDLVTAPLTTKRCLIEGTAESNHVDYAHCLQRATKGELLDSLEFAWKMDRFTLNVDSRYNVLRLSSKFHRAYDSGEWLLLPETWILDKYYGGKTSDNFPTIDKAPYKYTLIANPTMVDTPIHRQQFLESSPPATNHFTHYPHPYHGFPLITSHVHPRFIICNSCPKLTSDPLIWQRDHGDHDTAFLKVIAIWSSWIAPPLPGFLDKTSGDDSPDISDENSQKTSLRRIRHLPRPHPKRRREEQPSPTAKSSKHQRLSDGDTWLDEETLHKFEQQTSPHAHYTGLKEQLILDWLSNVSDSGCVVEVKGKLQGVRDSSIVNSGSATGQPCVVGA